MYSLNNIKFTYNYIFKWEVYVHNIFRNTFTIKFMWKVVTSSNLNPLLKLFFYSPILTNNNQLLKIYCENIVVTFLNFLFFILFLLSLISFHPYVFLSFFFLLHTRLSLSLYLPLLFFLFLPHSRSALILPFFSPAFALCFFFFFTWFQNSPCVCEEGRWERAFV